MMLSIKRIMGFLASLLVLPAWMIYRVAAAVLGADLEHVWRFAIAPGSMTSIRVWSDGAMAIEFVNDTSHLR